jgi:hypothetical protein
MPRRVRGVFAQAVRKRPVVPAGRS